MLILGQKYTYAKKVYGSLPPLVQSSYHKAEWSGTSGILSLVCGKGLAVNKKTLTL